MDRCDCCDGSDVFTCEGCGMGLATERVGFVDSSGIDYDPDTEHAIWVCVECAEREAKK